METWKCGLVGRKQLREGSKKHGKNMSGPKITKLLSNTGGLCWIKGTTHKAMFVQIPASGPVFTKGLYQPSFFLLLGEYSGHKL